MAGIAIVLDLLRKNPTSYSTQTLHSYGLITATSAASAAAASIAASTPFASRFLFGNGRIPVAYCDASPTWSSEDYMSNIRRLSGNVFQHDSLKYSTKEYHIELKPLFSAFEMRALAMTTLRSFLMFFLPLLEPKSNMEDEDFLEDTPDEPHIDLVVPLKKSVKQIIRETTVVTTRRILERMAVHYVSQRMAWKLLKDVPRSAMRKAERGMPTLVYFVSVSKTTFRGHFLGVTASWLIQVGIEIYHCLCRMINSKEEDDRVDKTEEIKHLGIKISGTTVRCGASLVFASIGAGLGASLIRPSIGQWIGCAVGDLAGPIVVSLFLEKLNADL